MTGLVHVKHIPRATLHEYYVPGRSGTIRMLGMGAILLPVMMGGSLAVGAITSWLQQRKLVGQQKTGSSNIANETEYYMQLNLDDWNSIPVKTESLQAFYADIFDQLWASLMSQQGCGSPALGSAGQRCIDERKRGGIWDWFSRYRDPISNDPDVTADAVVSAQGINPQTGQQYTAIESVLTGSAGGGLLDSKILLAGAALALALILPGMMGEK